jgi:hypothetical protein
MSLGVHNQRSSRLSVLLVCLMSCATAQSSPSLDIGGSVRAGIWSQSRSLDDVGPIPIAGLWLQAAVHLAEDKTIVADGWAQKAGGRSSVTDQEAHLRELFFKARIGDVDLRLGRQLIVWGRADAINPTDSIGRRNFTYLTVDDDDQREGSDAVAASYAMTSEYSLQAVWLPSFRSDVIPFRPQPMQTVTTIAPERRSQYAVKLDRSGGDVDWSLSYFDGYDRMPDLSLTGVGVGRVNTAFSNNAVQVLGADFSSSFDGVVSRGEIAWSQRDRDVTVGGFFRKRSQLLAVVGGDKTFGNSMNINLQFFGQWVPDYRSPDQLVNSIERDVAIAQAAINNQSGKSQFGMTSRLAKSWMNDTWQAELYVVYSITTHGTYVRGQVKRAINDKWRFIVGLDRYRGDADTVFGQLQHNSTAYAELRYVL